MQNIFFFQTQQISDDSNLFHQLKKQNIHFSYFQADQNYYILFYRQTPIDLHFIYQSIDVSQELDSKQRKIRSFRGYFLYALEIIQTAKDYQILKTNLQPFFWKKVHNIIRQNKKDALLEFLFPNAADNEPLSQDSSPTFDPKIKTLQKSYDGLRSQVDSLQQKVIQLEARVQYNSKDLLSDATQPLEPSKTTQQENYTFEVEKGPYLIENEHNFITLSKISEQQRIEIIKTGFQLQAEGTISLNKYYESKDTNSLFQFKRYSIKYESIRRTKLYQQLKLSNN